MAAMIRTFLALLVFVGVGSILRAEGPSETIPELKALGHYVGKWDVEVTLPDSPFTKGKATARWVLDGRFVEQEGTLQGKEGTIELKFRSLMTYDPVKKSYRIWTFLSDGFAGENVGTWDEKNKTMTSVSLKDENGGFTTTTADFSKDGFETWKIAFTDGSGQQSVVLSGKSSKQK